MTFQPNIPLATDLISVSQGDIKNNFTALSTSYNVNHIDFNVTGSGKHKFVEMPVRTVIPPGLVTAEGTIYTKLPSGNLQLTQLFYSPDNSTNEYVLTRTINSVPQFANFGNTTAGWTFAAGGIIIKYGIFANITQNFQTKAYPVAFPTGTIVLALTVNSSDTNTDAGAIYKSPTANGADIRLTDSSSTRDVAYIAIGY